MLFPINKETKKLRLCWENFYAGFSLARGRIPDKKSPRPYLNLISPPLKGLDRFKYVEIGILWRTVVQLAHH